MKYGLSLATSAVPSLGYENPISGELLKKMIIVGNNVDVNPNYALSTANEADMLFVVKSAAINNADSPEELLKQIRGVYPAIELPATFTSRFLADATGPRAGGGGVLPVINIAIRLFVRGNTMLPIPGKRSLAVWKSVLNGGLQVNDLLVRGGGNLSGTGGNIHHLDNLKRMLDELNAGSTETKVFCLRGLYRRPRFSAKKLN